MADLSRFCCLSPDCPLHGLRGQGNVAVRARYGGGDRLLLYCKACKKRFSERKGTPLFNCRLPDDKAASVLAHLQDGCGVRQTQRLVGVHRDTVTRLGRKAGEHAKAAHDELAAVSPLDDEAPAGREVVVRRQEGEELPPRRRRGRPAGG
jgi:LacI family transcriptional regulator